MHGSDHRPTPQAPRDRSISLGDLPSLRDERGEPVETPASVVGGPTSENPPPPDIAGLPEGLPVAPPTVIELSQQSAAAAHAAGSQISHVGPVGPVGPPAPIAPIAAAPMVPAAPPAPAVPDVRSEPIVMPTTSAASPPNPPLRTRATIAWDDAHAGESLDRVDIAGRSGTPASEPVVPTPIAPAPTIAPASIISSAPNIAPAPTIPSEPIIAAASVVAPVRSTPAPPAAPASIAPPANPDIDPDVMHDLLEQADRMMVQLQTGIEEARSTHAEPASLAHRLQERLRVGAKMLKAFQAQIDRAELVVTEASDRSKVAETLETHLDDATRSIAASSREEADRVKRELAAVIDAARTAIDERARRRERPAVEVNTIIEAVETHVSGKIDEVNAYFDERTPTLPTQETLDLRVEQVLAAAMERFDRHAAQRRSELDAQTANFDQLQARATAFAERLEATESRSEAIQTRSEESARSIRGELEEAHAVARQCLDARNGLAAELRKAVSGSDEIAARGERIRLDVDEQVTRYDRLQTHVSSSMGTIEDAVRRIDHAERIVDRLERLTDRLAPWEGLLTSGPQTAEGLPKSAVDLVDHIQSGLGRDIEAISTTMRDMAERMGGLAPRRTTTATVAASATTEPRPGGLDQPADGVAASSAAVSAIDGPSRSEPMNIDEARAALDSSRRSA
ncbi:MAG: hypothetical protein AB8G96_00200 [Phycisphaerales bacterium]